MVYILFVPEVEDINFAGNYNYNHNTHPFSENSRPIFILLLPLSLFFALLSLSF